MSGRGYPGSTTVWWKVKESKNSKATGRALKKKLPLGSGLGWEARKSPREVPAANESQRLACRRRAKRAIANNS